MNSDAREHPLRKSYLFVLLIVALIGTFSIVTSVTDMTMSLRYIEDQRVSQRAVTEQSRVYRARRKGSAPMTLFVIDTTEKNYQSRIPVIRETYLKRVRAKDSTELIFIGSNVTDGSDDMFASSCKVGYWEDSCKRADMITISYEVLKKPFMEVFDWIMFADDDAYILPDNLQRMIMTLGPEAVNRTAVWAIGACAHEKCVGICGGGGYLTNRKTLFLIQEGGNKTQFPSIRDETNKFDVECGRCGDLTIARVIKDHRRIPILDYPTKGIYVWNFKDGDTGLINSLNTTDPLPWLYHYPARNRFPFLHEKAAEFNSNRNLED